MKTQTSSLTSATLSRRDFLLATGAAAAAGFSLTACTTTDKPIGLKVGAGGHP